MSGKRRRLFYFILVILVGLGAGLAFGWLVMPPQRPTNASLTQLRADYKTDLVLMVAEQYQVEQDPLAALDQLTKIDTGDPTVLLENVIHYGEGIGYTKEDLEKIRTLASNIDAATLQEWQQRSPDNGK